MKAGDYQKSDSDKKESSDKKANGSENDSDGEDLDENSDEYKANQEKMKGKRKQKRDQNLGDLVKKNHYALLGLEDQTATTNEIKIAYRKLSLIYHPDKYEDGAYNDLAKQKWLNLQEAYETLMDTEKRRIYDSIMDFDEEIPGETLGDDEDFFETFGPVLRKNAYWSTKQNMPEFGDATSSYKVANKFYKWWDSFQSWRDFTIEDEYDIHQAENRYEKRYMERENKRMKAHLLKAERKRIQNLSNRARLNDPRIIAHEREEAEAKEKAILERQQEKQRKKDEINSKIKEQKDEEERKKREEEEAKEKEIDDKKKKIILYKAKVKTFRDITREKLDGCREFDKFFIDVFLPK